MYIPFHNDLTVITLVISCKIAKSLDAKKYVVLLFMSLILKFVNAIAILLIIKRYMFLVLARVYSIASLSNYNKYQTRASEK